MQGGGAYISGSASFVNRAVYGNAAKNVLALNLWFLFHPPLERYD